MTGAAALWDNKRVVAQYVINERWSREAVAGLYVDGEGIEIGALHNPVHLPPGVIVRYADRMNNEDLRKQYPELADKPLVDPHYICDGEKLDPIGDRTQDFVIACHFLEHCESPLEAIRNWLRVTRIGGRIFMAVPDKRKTFDARRTATPLDHVVRDYLQGPAWSRAQAFDEWARFVWQGNESVGPQSEEKLAEAAQCFQNLNYSIHFHAWSPKELLNILLYAQENIAPFEIDLFSTREHEMLAVIQKV